MDKIEIERAACITQRSDKIGDEALILLVEAGIGYELQLKQDEYCRQRQEASKDENYGGNAPSQVDRNQNEYGGPQCQPHSVGRNQQRTENK